MTCSDMGCSQQCYDTNDVVQCGCMRGFRLGLDAKTCIGRPMMNFPYGSLTIFCVNCDDSIFDIIYA